MPCRRLHELPPPPPGKVGWPWTEETPPLRNEGADAATGLKVSVVTPSFNQGQYLEETIRSVLLQGHPNLEYIVIDGGSSDGSVEIIRKYEPWLSYWTSEPDRGQSDAINKGFARASGQIFGWLNSDDVYEPGALQRVAGYFAAEPACELLYGTGWYLDANSVKTEACSWIRSFDPDLLLTFNFILQPAAFWRRSLWQRTGELNISYHWAMDWEWFIRATRTAPPHFLREDFARWRITPEIKTRSGGDVRRAELAEISRKYGGRWQPTYLAYRLDTFAHQVAGRYPFGRILQYAIIGIRGALQETVWRNQCLS
ncbi:MAG TPA: glycosyltransferase family 2 protein [Anaerolineae bacterium]